MVVFSSRAPRFQAPNPRLQIPGSKAVAPSPKRRSRPGGRFWESLADAVLGAVSEPIFEPCWNHLVSKLESRNHQKHWRGAQNQGFRLLASDFFSEAFWKRLRTTFDPEIIPKSNPRRHLGPSWGVRVRLGGVLEAPGGVLGSLGAVLASHGCVLERPDVVLRRLGALLVGLGAS